MAYKNILVHLDQTARSADRFKLGLNLAKRHQSQLSAYYATSMSYLFQGVEKKHRELTRAECAEQACNANVEFKWVPELESMTHLSLTERLSYQAYFADLTLIGQPDSEAGGAPPAPPRDLPEKLILTSGRPILTIPFAGEFGDIGSRIMVAWRSGRASARALQDAIPLMVMANSVILLSFASTRGERDKSEVNLKQLAEFLSLHGIKATTETRLISGISLGDALLNRVAEEGINLLVAGGALPTAPAPMASQLLKEMTVPILMSS